MITATAIEALYATGKWLLDEQRPHDAIHVFRAMLVASPADERAWLGLGAAHEALGEPQIALDLYAGCALAARGGRCDIARARVLRAFGREDDASVALDVAESYSDAHDDDALRALVARERAAP